MGSTTKRTGQLVLFVWMTALSFRYVSCVVMKILRGNRDKFTSPFYKDNCLYGPRSYYCEEKYALASVKFDGFCSCTCKRGNSTFLESNLHCVDNLQMRNKSSFKDWNYLLSNVSSSAEPILSIYLLKNSSIEFRINAGTPSQIHCVPYEVEIANRGGGWNSVENKLDNKGIKQSKTATHFVVTLKWNGSPSSLFAGKIMRVRIRCDDVDDFIIFKVNGELEVEIPDKISIHTKLPSMVATSSPIPSLTYSTKGLTNSQTTATKTTTTTTTLKTATVTASSTALSSSPTVVLSSSLPATSSDTQSSSKRKKPIVLPTVTSSASGNMFTSYVSSTAVQNTTPVPEKHSDGSSVAKTVTGAVVGVVVAVAVIVLILCFLRKRKLREKSRSDAVNMGTPSTKGGDTPTLSNPVYEQQTYEDPANIDKEKQRQSGIKSIQSAMYDQCVPIDNPSSTSPGTNVCANVGSKPNEPKNDHTYQDLDPKKRDPSSKYQGLVKPTNEYSTIPGNTADAPESAMYDQCIPIDNPSSTSPGTNVYANVGSKPNEPKNDHTYQDLDPKKRDPSSKYQGLVKPTNEYSTIPGNTADAPVYSLPNDGPLQTSEPVYNVLDRGEPNVPVEKKNEPVYNVLDRGEPNVPVEKENEPLYNVLEQSGEAKRDPVYSVLEDDKL